MADITCKAHCPLLYEGPFEVEAKQWYVLAISAVWGRMSRFLINRMFKDDCSECLRNVRSSG